jgi:hypothetical protein
MLMQGRQTRIGRILEIVEACQELGERLNVDVIADVLDELEAELEQAAAAIPTTARPITPEEFRAALGLSILGQALEDTIAYLEGTSALFSARNELLQVRNQLGKCIVQRFIARLPQEARMTLVTESKAWGYVLLSPAHRRQILELLDTVSKGGMTRKETRALAVELREKMQGLRPTEDA